MRTTIDLSPSHRARLLRLAAERGERGFSNFIAEALDAYFDNRRSEGEASDVRRLRGVLTEADAREMEERVRVIRESWR